MAKKKRKLPAPAKFTVGDRVRVKHGIRDTDYPDMPLSGWAGIISEVHKGRMYTVRWSQETLDAIHPVFKKRCEKDGAELEEYCLGETDIELDPGGPLAIEQPKEIKSKPLCPNDQDDRIRTVFGFTSNDPLPDVDDDLLDIYQQHLTEHLSFPFEAEHTPESGTLFPCSYSVKVVGLGDPDDGPLIDDACGILCQARYRRRTVILPLGELEIRRGMPNRQLVADYCDWFRNHG
ncbi:hypothetical protein ACFL5Q_02760 [Planctomycetota bacterium]